MVVMSLSRRDTITLRKSRSVSRMAIAEALRPRATANRSASIHASGEFNETVTVPVEMTQYLLLVVGIEHVLEGQAALNEITLERFPEGDDLRTGGDGARTSGRGALLTSVTSLEGTGADSWSPPPPGSRRPATTRRRPASRPALEASLVNR